MSQKIEFTEEDRKAFAGLLPFAPGASVPFTPTAFESVAEARRPVFSMGPFSKEARILISEHVSKGTLTNETMAEILVMPGSACRGWIRLYSLPDGEEVPFSKESAAVFPDWLLSDLWTMAQTFTYGPTKEEKRALT